ncbi:MAG: hypothetical protein U0599_17790 [Vicinamibacteria bacterium]
MGTRLGRLLVSEHLVLVLSLAVFLALVPLAPALARPENLANLLSSLLPLLIVTAGQLLVLLAGGIDLSQTSTIALASVTGAWVMSSSEGWLAGHPLAVPAALAAMLLAGAAVGAFNGVAVARLGLPAFIVTLTSTMFVSGLAVFLTRSRNVNGLPASFLALGGRIPGALALALAVAALVHLLLARSLYGRWLYAVGRNAVAARVSGVPVEGVTIAVYVASGVLAALASVLYHRPGRDGIAGPRPAAAARRRRRRGDQGREPHRRPRPPGGRRRRRPLRQAARQRPRPPGPAELRRDDGEGRRDPRRRPRRRGADPRLARA